MHALTDARRVRSRPRVGQSSLLVRRNGGEDGFKEVFWVAGPYRSHRRDAGATLKAAAGRRGAGGLGIYETTGELFNSASRFVRSDVSGQRPGAAFRKSCVIGEEM